MLRKMLASLQFLWTVFIKRASMLQEINLQVSINPVNLLELVSVIVFCKLNIQLCEKLQTLHLHLGLNHILVSFTARKKKMLLISCLEEYSKYAGIYIFVFIIIPTRKRCEICSKLITKTPERRLHFRYPKKTSENQMFSDVFRGYRKR